MHCCCMNFVYSLSVLVNFLQLMMFLLIIEKVHRVLVDIVSAAANATPGLGRYPPFKREVCALFLCTL